MPKTNLSAPPVPPLVDGDRLTRDEFERRWDAMPELMRAELIEGVVRIPGPAPLTEACPRAAVAGWAGYYQAYTPGTSGGVLPSLRLDPKNETQPDMVLLLTVRGRRTRVGADRILEGAPELVIEVEGSHTPQHLRAKYHAYQRNGVREYLVVRSERADWFTLRGGAFHPLAPRSDGLLCSETFPGLWLDVGSLLGEATAGLLAGVRRGLASPEHTAFVAELARRGGAP